jgi:hypothetical protein
MGNLNKIWPHNTLISTAKKLEYSLKLNECNLKSESNKENRLIRRFKASKKYAYFLVFFSGLFFYSLGEVIVHLLNMDILNTSEELIHIIYHFGFSIIHLTVVSWMLTQTAFKYICDDYA